MRGLGVVLFLAIAAASFGVPGAAAETAEGELTSHSDNVYCLQVDRDGQRLLSASADNTARVWDWKNRQTLLVIEHKTPVYAAAFSPDGRIIATCAGDGQVALWQAASGSRIQVLGGHRAPVYSIAFSEDGRWLASGSGEPENECIVWEVAGGGRLLFRGPGHQRPIYGVAFSPSWLATSSSDKTVRLWPLPGFGQPRILAGHSSDGYRCAFSAGGGLLATASQDKTVRIWDVASGTTKWSLTGHRDPVYAVAFRPGEEILATGGDDGSVHLWDTRTGKLQKTWKGEHPEAIFALTFAPDGTLFSAGAEGKISIWKLH